MFLLPESKVQVSDTTGDAITTIAGLKNIKTEKE
jgi:hypothetical protein